MRFKIDWASHIVGSKFTVFSLFYFLFEGDFPITSPRWAYIWRGDLTEFFFCDTGLGGLYFEGLIFGILRVSLRKVAEYCRGFYGEGPFVPPNIAANFRKIRDFVEQYLRSLSSNLDEYSLSALNQKL